MKISFLLTTGDSKAGTEHAIQSQIRSLVSRGHEISVFSLYRTDGSLSEAIGDVARVTYWLGENAHDLSGNFDVLASRELNQLPAMLIRREWDDQFSQLTELVAREELGKIRADVVVTTTPALAMLGSLFLPGNTVLVAQEHRASMQRGKGIEPLQAVAHDLDAIVSLNQENKEWIDENFQAQGFVSEIVPNSLDDIFRPQSTLDNKTVIAAGRFAPGKQFNHLIRAFAIFHADHPDWKLRLYGNGPQELALRELVGELNLQDAVAFTTDLGDLTMEWQNASIHAMTSRAEGQPLVILESAAAGVPTVAYDCPIGPRNIVTHGVDGLLVPLNDVQLFAESLATLADNSALRNGMGKRAILTASRYTPDLVVDRWIQLYSDLLERRAGTESRSETNRRHMRITATAEDPNLYDADKTKNFFEKDSPVPFEVSIVEPDDLSVGAVQTKNFDDAVRFLESGQIAHVNVPAYGYFRRSIAIRSDDREQLLLTLLKESLESLCVKPLRGNSVISSSDWHPGIEQLSAMQAETADVFRLFTPESDPLRRFTWGSAFGVDIEIWSYDEERSGWVPPRHNPGVDLLLDHDFDSNSQLFYSPLWDQIDFPIDVVYTWVDDSDPDWRSQKEAHSPASDDGGDLAAGAMRFRNRDELKYSVRSVRTFMPWVRNIYVVTADQRPAWLSQESEIQVISHREIFPDPSVLPVFNSHAIESCLHRIPGLAEHFLYFNDDTMLLRMQVPANYFHANGIAKFFLSPVKVDLRPQQDVEPHMWAAQNNRRVLQERFGKVITRAMLHTPHPHRRSTLQRIETDYSEIFKSVRAAKFRSETDISLLSSFAQYFGYFTGTYEPGSVRYAYCSLGDDFLRPRLSNLVATDRFDMITFGEAENANFSSAEVDEMLDQFFRARFPYPTIDEV
ncbi:stealth conserved region 3 domain-containing protein [Glutamicibacter protophormiae]|uniref:Glycosyltransferase involved in cell wall biosynthesis n=1 Tax=Glutamicibacter protophormiae TaxID=37930 RepID=A0ABS4XSH0_GLUPR|nr:stealth conserved region 3 domain-containing protein [Glutamicibacter protophormiae]MBP2399456.1 glycosyltransferase involved in cell wall biosynthesis [Glutamicibacter protophormiae]GGL84675.1 exopolysaccharide phosphotransferase [Glutamicibacter protophormiae]